MDPALCQLNSYKCPPGSSLTHSQHFQMEISPASMRSSRMDHLTCWGHRMDWALALPAVLELLDRMLFTADLLSSWTCLEAELVAVCLRKGCLHRANCRQGLKFRRVHLEKAATVVDLQVVLLRKVSFISVSQCHPVQKVNFRIRTNPKL